MLAIKDILFPTDFSDQCTAVAPFVKAMATQFGAKITLLSVLQPFWQSAAADPGGAVAVDFESLRQDLETRLACHLVREFNGLEVERLAQIGEPASMITQFAHSEGTDLIMLPTHGYGPFRTLLLGSVASKVLHDADCPVWTAAHCEKPALQTHLPIRSVLCAVDGTRRSVPLMEWASRFCDDAGASLRLIHAVSGMESWPEARLSEEYETEIESESLEAIRKMQKSASIEAPVCVGAGEISGVVRDEAIRHNIDLVVIGRGMLDETLGRLRTHSYAIIRRAPCPVLSV